jgi:hypothetical protein
MLRLMRSTWWILICAACALPACGDSGGGNADASSRDAAADGRSDAGGPAPDAATDAAADAPAGDATTDAPGDAPAGDGGEGDDGGTGVRQLDLVFLIDDSSSMTTIQQTLAANFPTFLRALRDGLGGTLPDLHIGVVTSDMGAGAFTSSVPGCTIPDLGAFVSAPRAATSAVCQTARLTGAQPYISSSGNGTVNNFSGALEDVFGCLAQVGSAGCGFEHQLAAVRAALGDPTRGLPAPPGNAGFLRAQALLAIVFITNEDDCSAPPDSELFDPNQTLLSDPLGPLASFRCTEFGLLCGGQRIARAAGGPYAMCTSNDAAAQTDPLHSLIPAQLFIDYLARIKADPARVVAAAIMAPSGAPTVAIDQTSGYPMLQHSCVDAAGRFGDPPIRLAQVLASLGSRSLTTSICQDSYAQVMTQLAALIAATP